MIKLSLGDLYSKCYVIPVDNVPSNYEWPRHVLSYSPRINTVYSNNEFVEFLFKDCGIEVRKTPILSGISGTLIRRAIAEGKEWKHMVPGQVAEFIDMIRGDERIRTIWRTQISLKGERY